MRINRSTHRRGRSRCGALWRVGAGILCVGLLSQHCAVLLHFSASLSAESSSAVASSSHATQSLNRQPSLSKESSLNKLLYTGFFGLGHRLSKLSAAVSLARHLDVPLVHVDWGTCVETDRHETNIFAHLFGSNQIALRPPRVDRDYQRKVIWVRNDVAGYAAAQSYKNAAIPVNTSTVAAVTQQLQADSELWTDLWHHRWTGRTVVDEYQRQTGWHTHGLVIGVHVRAGNGELDHFVAAKRGLHGNSSSMKTAVSHMARLIRQLIQRLSQEPVVTPLIFVATDTVPYIAALRDALLPYTVVSYEAQPRVAFGHGVSYQAWSSNATSCLAGWNAAAVDLALLADTDVLVATSRSTFTQIVPASLVFRRSKAPWRFCEMELLDDAFSSRMTCFSSQHAWLFRRPRSHMFTVCARDNGPDTCDESTMAVAHKVMVHLPHLDGATTSKLAAAAHDFLQPSTDVSNETLFYYGKKFDAKYRRKMPFRRDWTWNE